MNRLMKRAKRPISALVAGFLVFASLLTASPATAEEQDPSTYAYTIAGTLIQGEDPVPGVEITASLDDFSATATSDEDGAWMIMVPTEGTYIVEINRDTIPAGFALSDAENGYKVDADLTQTDFAAVLFEFGESTVQETSLSDLLLAQIFSGLNFGLMLALAAIGITLVYGTTGLNNFAHGDMVTMGALFTWLFYIVLQLNIVVAVVLATLVVAASGWAQNRFLWQPLRKRRTGLNQMMIISIGFGIVFRYSLILGFGGQAKDIGGGGNSIAFGPVQTSDLAIVSMIISALALIGVALFLTKTRIGKATRAVSDNPALAASTGIDVENIIRIVWILAAALTGLAGVLYGLQFQANWLLGYELLLLLFAAVTLGGLGAALGAAVGAIIIGMVVEVSTVFIPTDLKYVAALVILIVILIVRPQGILGKKQRIG